MLREIFEYHHHFNQKLIDELKKHTNSLPERTYPLFCHVLNAHQIWNNRIDHRHAAFDVWQMHDLDTCRDIDKGNHAHTLDIINTLDLNRTIRYGRKGKAFDKKFSEILFHIINHSTYHRGQIAAQFRQSGLDPLVSDFVFYEGV